MPFARLTIHADDFGYGAAYDLGMIEAARAGAIDGVSVMVLRDPDIEPLIATDVELGLHLERDRDLGEQLERFQVLAGRAPDYIDGHHHCHAEPPMAAEVAALGRELDVPVRSIDAAHRRFLRERGVATPEALLGRMGEGEDPMPAEISAWLDRGVPPAGLPATIEWMVHPGHRDPSGGSAYDRGRAEDLALLLELGDPARWARRGVSRGRARLEP